MLMSFYILRMYSSIHNAHHCNHRPDARYHDMLVQDIGADRFRKMPNCFGELCMPLGANLSCPKSPIYGLIQESTLNNVRIPCVIQDTCLNLATNWVVATIWQFLWSGGPFRGCILRAFLFGVYAWAPDF